MPPMPAAIVRLPMSSRSRRMRPSPRSIDFESSGFKDTDVNAENEASAASVDDIEKLKALEELQQDKVK